MTQFDNKSRNRTRHQTIDSDLFDPSQPRIGRRESEPHSFEISYLHDVISNNFPNHHVLWDLHHYFQFKDREIDIQFDISFFLNTKIPITLSSYKAVEYGNKIPHLVINILSKSTWRNDLSENVDICRLLKIPYYVVFCPFDVATSTYTPPFLRIYSFTDGNQNINFKDFRDVCIDSNGEFNQENLFSFDENIPFRIGLMKLEKMHEKNRELYRLLIIDQNKLKLLLPKVDKEKKRADEEKKRADEEKKRADEYLKLLNKHGIDPSK
jgi:hypothetical protein